KAFACDAEPVAEGLAVAEHGIEVVVRCIDDDRARRFFGGIINERATELGCQFLLRAGLGPHVRWECGHIALIIASSRPGHRRIFWSWTNFMRPHRLLANCILFGPTGLAVWGSAAHR